MTQPITTRHPLPDPSKRGECAVKVSFTCDLDGRERLNPLSMLPNPKVSADYTMICQPCYDMLCDTYMKSVNR